jgi:hypothetical protein
MNSKQINDFITNNNISSSDNILLQTTSGLTMNTSITNLSSYFKNDNNPVSIIVSSDLDLSNNVDLNNQTILSEDTSGSGTTGLVLTLPDSPFEMKTIIVKDYNGQASTKPITIKISDTTPSDIAIDYDRQEIIINEDYGSVKLTAYHFEDGGNNYIRYITS